MTNEEYEKLFALLSKMDKTSQDTFLLTFKNLNKSFYNFIKLLSPADLKLLIEERKLIIYLIENDYFTNFNRYLSKNKSLKESIRDFYCHDQIFLLSDYNKMKVSDIPKFLYDFDYKIISKYTSFEKLQNYDESVIICDLRQRIFFEIFTKEELTNLEEETALFFNDHNKFMSISNHIGSYLMKQDKNYLIKLKQMASWDEKLTKIIADMMQNHHFNICYNQTLLNKSYQDKHPELYIDKNAPKNVYNAFYLAHFTIEMYLANEPYLKNERLSIIRENVSKKN